MVWQWLSQLFRNILNNGKGNVLGNSSGISLRNSLGKGEEEVWKLFRQWFGQWFRQ
jgi:hypothetical protein